MCTLRPAPGALLAVLVHLEVVESVVLMGDG